MSAAMVALLLAAAALLAFALAALAALLAVAPVAALYALRHAHPRIMRAWWWCGYHLGLYRIDWKLKWLRYRRDPVVRCEAGSWRELRDGRWLGWRCSKVKCHWLGCRRVHDVREPW